ncbi:MAG: hypothetical protein LBR43_01310 [Spiroplasmataceae bacterium]|nr:hypothetical protein [Spiroplasmataceae bacterium]
MTEKEEKITSIKNVEDQEKLKIKYEAESKEKDQKILELENLITKKNDEIFELQKSNEKLAEERDDWKKETHAARRVQQETKEFKETTDFLTELAKLQAKKGIILNLQETNE